MSILTIIRQRRHRRTQTRSSAQQRSQRAAFGLGFTVSAALVVGVLAAALAYAALTRDLPPVEQLSILLNPGNGLLLQPTRLYDRTGQHLLAVLAPKDAERIYADYRQIPQTLIKATIAQNQPDFWHSPGYSIKGWNDPYAHPTLAQRLVSDLLLGDQAASPIRGIHERMLAAQITARFGREQVLEWVLNSTDYGRHAYGVEAASELYFGKSVTQIDLAEAAMLAAIGQSPAINPIDASKAAEEQRLQVLRSMLNQGLITPAETAQAVRNPPTLRATLTPPDGTGAEGSLAPALVNLALSQLDKQFGAGRVERGGLTVTTTLDYDLQLQALCVTRTLLNRLSGAGAELPESGATACPAASLLPALRTGESLPDASASIVLLDPQTGQVLAAVGDLQGGLQSDLLASHPAGTTITPFIYLTGFSRGLNPASLGWDIPANAPAPGQIYHGPVRLRTALANDYLPPALHLLDQMGQESVQSIAAPFGLYVPSGLHLLQDDFPVSPLALAEAYGILADGGSQAGQAIGNGSLHSYAVMKVSAVDHSIWVDWTVPRTRLLLSPQLDYLMNQVLSDETARWPSLGHPNPLEIGRPAGAKLSVSLDLTAAWTVGYTPQRVGVVWLSSGTAGPASGVSKSPALSGNAAPALVGNAAPALVGNAAPALVGNEVPALVGNAAPALVGNEVPALVGNEVPALSESEVAVPVPPHLSADLWHALMQVAVRDLPSMSWDVPTGIVNVPVCNPSGLIPTPACPNVVNEIFLEGRQPVQLDTLFQVFQVNAETGLLATVFTPPELVEKRTYMLVPPDARLWARGAGISTPPTAYDTVQEPPGLPDVHITTPKMFSDGRLTLAIRGSAAGPDFISYRLEFGKGLYPSLWEQIGSDGNTPVTEGQLGIWDTNGLNGLYALRLMVVRRDQRVDQAVVQVTLDNTPPQLAITYPQMGQTISLAQEPQMALQAQVGDPFLENVEFFMDGEPVGQTNLTPFGVVWASKTGKHTLRVVATDRAGNTAESEITFTVGK